MVLRQKLEGEVLQGLTLMGARNLVVECFFRAQKETFARGARSLGVVPSDEDLERTVRNAVMHAFQSAGANFEEPTRETLMAAVEKLAGKAAAMGTPKDIIERHRAQLARVFEALER